MVLLANEEKNASEYMKDHKFKLKLVKKVAFQHLRDQLGVGLIAQLVEHSTGITERVMGSNPVQA